MELPVSKAENQFLEKIRPLETFFGDYDCLLRQNTSGLRGPKQQLKARIPRTIQLNRNLRSVSWEKRV